MSKLYFMNNGHFDKRAMMTFGVNVKENDNAVGFFGTGFKYAVAIILRHSGKISVTTKNEDGQTELITFTKSTETIRGEEFDLVKMNGQDIGFTTRLGINWKPWQAYRELYSNCIDENGEVSEKPGDYDTSVIVDCQDIFNAWHNQSVYFLSGEPVYSGNGVEIYRQTSPSPYIYYQGIAVSDCDDGLFTYNMTHRITLTEDRTAKYPNEITDQIKRCWLRMDDEELLIAALGSKKCMESRLDFASHITPSEKFLEVADNLKKTGRGVNDSVRKILKKHRQRKGEYEGRPISPTEQIMIDRSIVFLKGMGFDVDEYEILVVNGMGDGIFGRALKGKIYLSDRPFQAGTKQVASTILEEWAHIKLDCDDFTRKMQDWLFDKILSIGEEINGEPL